MKAAGLALVLLSGATRLAAQGVVIAPHAVFIDARTRSGAVLLYNPNTDPVEVAVSFFFGYPATDSAGRIVVDSIRHPDSTSVSAAAWIQAFPRRLTVPPLERPTVRLLPTPPPLPAGLRPVHRRGGPGSGAGPAGPAGARFGRGARPVMSRLRHSGLLLLALLVPRPGVSQGVGGTLAVDANIIGQALTVTTL